MYRLTMVHIPSINTTLLFYLSLPLPLSVSLSRSLLPSTFLSVTPFSGLLPSPPKNINHTYSTCPLMQYNQIMLQSTAITCTTNLLHVHCTTYSYILLYNPSFLLQTFHYLLSSLIPSFPIPFHSSSTLTSTSTRTCMHTIVIMYIHVPVYVNSIHTILICGTKWPLELACNNTAHLLLHTQYCVYNPSQLA